MSIKKSQAILKHFINLKFNVWFTLCSENETIFLGHFEHFSGRLPVVNTLNDRETTLLAESPRSFLDNSGKGREERGKRNAEGGKRKEVSGKRKGEAEKVSSVTKRGFVFCAQRKPNAKLEIYKAFQDRLTFLIDI